MFGRRFFLKVLPFYKTQLMAYVRLRKETVGPNRQQVIDSYFPMFLDLFQQELANAESPIWDPNTASEPPVKPPQPQRQPQPPPPRPQVADSQKPPPQEAEKTARTTQEEECARRQQMLEKQQRELYIQQQKLNEQQRQLEQEIMLQKQQMRAVEAAKMLPPPPPAVKPTVVVAVKPPPKPEALPPATVTPEPRMTTSTPLPEPQKVVEKERPKVPSRPPSVTEITPMEEDDEDVEEEEEEEPRDADFLRPWIPAFTDDECTTMINDGWRLVQNELDPRPVFDELGKVPREAVAYKDELNGDLELGMIWLEPGEAGITEQRKLWFLQLVKICQRHLPCMPRSHVARCVFGQYHRTLVVVRNNECIAALCCRCYRRKKFAELSFVVVQTRDQSQGFGTYLMHTFFDCVKQLGIKRVIVCTDEFAAGYFKRFGFTREVSTVFPNKKDYGGVDELEGGVFYALNLDPDIVYSELFSVMKLEAAVLKMMWEYRNKMLEEVEVDGSELFLSPGTVLKTCQIPGLKKFGHNEELEKSLMERDGEVLPGACPPDSDEESGRNSSLGNTSTGSITNGKSGGSRKDGKKRERGRKVTRPDLS